MKAGLLPLLAGILLGIAPDIQAQRLSDPNTVGWFCSLNTIHLSKRTSIWAEYQWRRDEVLTQWQQSLFRTGLQYQFPGELNGLSAIAGYGYIITYPFGDYPAGPNTIPEHRIYEQLSWNGNLGSVGLNHRVRLEQRYLGKVDQMAAEQRVHGWTYLNRFRYQLRATLPLGNKKPADKTWYMAAYDEVFIGFGRNVNQNIFDQNRIGILLGYQLNKNFRAEAGYLNQTVQQGGLIKGREVMQYNNGIIVNVYTTLFN